MTPRRLRPRLVAGRKTHRLQLDPTRRLEPLHALVGWQWWRRAPPEVGTDGDRYTVAAWSRANDLVFNVLSKNNPGGDLWTLSMAGDRTPKAYVNSKSTRTPRDLLT